MLDRPDDIAREKFFNYLKGKGVFEQMITINSRTLNAFAKVELETANEEGVLDFQIPGLTKSDPVFVAKMTGVRK